MEPVLIAHLSDLHFGENEHEKVWDEVVRFINDDLRPHLILITGDIVNTPDPALFRRAKVELDRLRTRSKPEFRYRVCPGNHDRFKLGNSAGTATGFFSRLLGVGGETNIMRPSRGELENHFKGGHYSRVWLFNSTSASPQSCT